MTTIRDVAAHAGVSISTVSRILTNSAPVNPDLAERVRASMRTLQYRPSRAARSMRVARSRIIGLLISDIRNPFFTEFICSVDDVARNRGYSVILCNSDENPRREQQCLEVLLTEEVAGVIIVPVRERLRELRLLWEQHVPVVAVDRRVRDRDTDVILVDNVRGAREAVTHLIANGYRRIGLVGGPPTMTAGYERREGYRQALSAAGLPLDPALERTGSWSWAAWNEHSGRRLAAELLDLEQPPDALFVANNLLAMDVLDELHARNLRVPADIAIVGFDEMPWATMSAVSLTTVAQPVSDLGTTAAQRLFQRLERPDAFTRQEIVLAPTLNIRESSHPRPPRPKELNSIA